LMIAKAHLNSCDDVLMRPCLRLTGMVRSEISPGDSHASSH
jgi:hypothetical protein